MSSRKVIVVTGATGLQGGSVARFLLKDGTFAVRALTRNPDSAKAKALAAQGVQIVKADSRDPVSLVKAFEGAYGAFGLTNYWEPGVGGNGERSQGKALVDAAKSTGVEHFIWSTLDHSEFKADHWESKADVDHYLKSSGVPRTSLYTSFFFENFSGMLRLKERPDGTFDFPMPLVADAPFAIYAAVDTGAYALAAFKHPEEWLNKDMRIASEFLSTRDMAKIFGEVLGRTVHVPEISPDMFERLNDSPIPNGPQAEYDIFLPGHEVTDRGLWVPYIQSMKLLFHYNKSPFRDVELTRKLYRETQSFRAWVEANASSL